MTERLSESEIQSSIILNLSHANARLFRMQVGNFQLIDGRRIVCGIPGMSDLVGYSSIEVTPDMVGTRIAVYTAVEVKSGSGRMRDGQMEFIEMVRGAGGFAGVARSTDDARTILRLP